MRKSKLTIMLLLIIALQASNMYINYQNRKMIKNNTVTKKITIVKPISPDIAGILKMQ